jgi:hypothetical protein
MDSIALTLYDYIMEEYLINNVYNQSKITKNILFKSKEFWRLKSINTIIENYFNKIVLEKDIIEFEDFIHIIIYGERRLYFKLFESILIHNLRKITWDNTRYELFDIVSIWFKEYNKLIEKFKLKDNLQSYTNRIIYKSVIYQDFKMYEKCLKTIKTKLYRDFLYLAIENQFTEIIEMYYNFNLQSKNKNYQVEDFDAIYYMNNEEHKKFIKEDLRNMLISAKATNKKKIIKWGEEYVKKL